MNCKVEHCSSLSEQDGLCNIHYHRSSWLDNSDINNLGIVRFAKAIVPEWVEYNTAPFQKEIYYNFFKMYDKKFENKYDRLLAEIGFRGAAKTTQSKILLLYLCCFGLEKLIIYCSETNSFAVQDVFEVRKELGTNPYIKTYFGVINSKKVKGYDGEWSKDAFETATGTCVLARGVGQQVRSVLKNSSRPTLALINDMYGKDAVKTEYTRDQYKKWFFQDMFNAVDDIKGKVFFNGTILHEDTVPVIIEQNSMWKTFKYPVMNVDHFHEAINKCTTTDTTFELCSDKEIEELESHSDISWKERLGLKYILRKYKECFESSQIEGFYQEYFHVVVPPTARNFMNVKKAYMRYFRERDRNWLAVKYFPEGEEVIYPINIFFGVDPASSTKAYSAYSVIAILMMNPHRQVFYYGYSRGKYGLRDEAKPDTILGSSDIVRMDTSSVLRKGIVDEEIRLAKTYFPNGSEIETTQAQEHIYTEVARLMRLNNANHPLFSEKPRTDKVERDAEMLVPDFQSNSAFINYGLNELDIEIKSFPRGITIDIIDAFYHARKIAIPPMEVDYQSFIHNKQRPEEIITEFHLL